MPAILAFRVQAGESVIQDHLYIYTKFKDSLGELFLKSKASALSLKVDIYDIFLNLFRSLFIFSPSPHLSSSSHGHSPQLFFTSSTISSSQSTRSSQPLDSACQSCSIVPSLSTLQLQGPANIPLPFHEPLISSSSPLTYSMHCSVTVSVST